MTPDLTGELETGELGFNRESKWELIGVSNGLVTVVVGVANGLAPATGLAGILTISLGLAVELFSRTRKVMESGRAVTVGSAQAN